MMKALRSYLPTISVGAAWLGLIALLFYNPLAFLLLWVAGSYAIHIGFIWKGYFATPLPGEPDALQSLLVLILAPFVWVFLFFLWSACTVFCEGGRS